MKCILIPFQSHSDRRLLDNSITVMWVDNFSKSYAVALQGIEAGAWKDCNWTGRGIKTFTGHDVIITLGDQSAMPDDIFSDANVDVVRRNLSRKLRPGWRILKYSIVHKWQVNNVPLKPVLDSFRHPALSRVLSESRDGLTSFVPMDVIPHNIGSNRGLMLILKQISDERRVDDDRMQFLCVDCNVFMRILRVSDMIDTLTLLLTDSYPCLHVDASEMRCDYDGMLRAISLHWCAQADYG